MMRRKLMLTDAVTVVTLLILLTIVLIPLGCSKPPAETSFPEHEAASHSFPRPETDEETIDEETIDPVEKYYHYFAGNRHFNPLFAYNNEVGDISDDNLMIFAIQNLPDYNYEEGKIKEEIDAILIKYFGRTVNSYVTTYSEYIPGTDRITATGWSFHGSTRLVLTNLSPNSDWTLTGHFDVYYIPELYFEDYPGDWNHLDQSLLSGNPGQYASLLTHKAIINFDEILEPEGGGFYLKYNSIKAINMDNPSQLLTGDFDYDERNFDVNSRFAADEATFNGITTNTTKEHLTARLGEPFEIIKEPEGVGPGSTTYSYGGVAYIFEGESDTVTYINVTAFQWKYGPRNIRVGDTFADVLARFPQEQDYQSHINNCFYGETTYLEEGGAVYIDVNGNIENITVVPKDVLPFMKIYFTDDVVSSYIIYGATT